MAGNLSDYAEKKLLDHLLGTTSYTMPSAVYLALYTAAPTDSSGGTEVTGGSYVRKVVTFDEVTSGSGSTTNDTTLDFTGMPSCTVVAVAVLDALTSGNILVYGTLSTNKTLDSGDILRVASGDLSITIA
jgi:hypothetical protein